MSKARWWWLGAGLVAVALVAVTIYGSKTKPAEPVESAPSLINLLPRTGTYARPDGYTQQWVVTHEGNNLTVAKHAPGNPTYTDVLAIKDGCLIQKYEMMDKSGPAGPGGFSWYCWPTKSFTDAYWTEDAHVLEKATEGYQDVKPFGHVLHVQVLQHGWMSGGPLGDRAPFRSVIDRYFKPGQGLVKETMSGGYDLTRVLPAFQRRPLFRSLTVSYFGAYPGKLPFHLLAPGGLPFSTYIPASNQWGSQAVQVGDASGVLYGSLQNGKIVSMLMEVMFLPKATALSVAVANMRQAELSFEKSPYDLFIWKHGATGRYLAWSDQPNQIKWIIKEDVGTRAAISYGMHFGTADLGEYQGQYFYIIKTGWYESMGLPFIKEWRWADGKSFYQGVTAAK